MPIEGKDDSGWERHDAAIALFVGVPGSPGTIRWKSGDKRVIASTKDLRLHRYIPSPVLSGWLLLSAPLDLPGIYDLAMRSPGANVKVSEMMRWKTAVSFLADCTFEGEVTEVEGGRRGKLTIETIRRDMTKKSREVGEDGRYTVERVDIGIGRENQFSFVFGDRRPPASRR